MRITKFRTNWENEVFVHNAKMGGTLIGVLNELRGQNGTMVELQKIPVVVNYPDVFPDELFNILPTRIVIFHIDLTPGATPIQKLPIACH